VLRVALISIVLFLSALSVAAQDLEPRAYAASPIGVRFLLGSFGRSSGGVVLDPSLPVEDVQAVVDSVVVGAGTTFALFGRTALLVAAIPYAWAEATGRIGEQAAEIHRSGLADSRLKLSVNLLGGKALTPREFARARKPTIVGVSVTVQPPTGQYYNTKLINLGTNRWAFKPEVGVSRAINRWTVEGYAGAILFTTNDEFYPGASVRTQDRVLALQGHVSYTLRPRAWAAFDATWYTGGTTTVNGMLNADLQRNSRLGATISFPLADRQSIKVGYSTGATTRFGGDFNTLAVAWQLTWLDTRARPTSTTGQP
jgi:hypothetical protein